MQRLTEIAAKKQLSQCSIKYLADFFLSQSIVFAVLMILLVGLSEAKRVAVKRNHVSGAVWLPLLSALAGCGFWLVSYQAGTLDVTRFLSDSFFRFSSRSS